MNVLPPWSYYGEVLVSIIGKTVILLKRRMIFYTSKLGWNHDRTRPLVRDECGFFIELKIQCEEEDMNHFGFLTREQGHQAASPEERKMVYHLGAVMGKLQYP